MKKRALAVMLAGAMVLGAQTGVWAASDTSDQKEGELTLLMVNDWIDETGAKGEELTKVIKQYEEENPSFFHVIIHVAKPGLFVTALFCFMTSWDEYMYASIFINTTSKKTIQVGMQDFIGQYSVDWGLLMSAVVISLIPILIFFALVQKNLVQGLSAGAVKG